MYLSAKALVVREASPPVLTRWFADRLAILDRVPNPVVAKQLRLRCAVGEGVPGKASDTALVLTTCEYPLNLVLNAQGIRKGLLGYKKRIANGSQRNCQGISMNFKNI